MDKTKFFILAEYSLILGAGLGFISLFPYLNILGVLLMSVFSSTILVIYLQKEKIFSELTLKGGAILGVLIGVLSLCGFLAVFLPIMWLLGTIFDKATYFMSFKFLWQIWWVLLSMGSIITALFNSFALMAYIYIKDTFFMIEGSKEVKSLNIDLFKKKG